MQWHLAGFKGKGDGRGPYMISPHNANYRWVIVLGGIAGLFAGLGLGRFSLGMMLPAMGEALGLSYSQMGLISTFNLCGYLLAVLLCGTLSVRFGPRLLIGLALGLVGFSMVFIGLTSHYLLILLLYFLTGVGSALANVPIMALIAVWFDSNSRGRAAGFCVMGNGLGILVSGKGVPLFNEMAQGWRMSWFVLGALVCLISLFCFFILRNRPERGKQKVVVVTVDENSNSSSPGKASNQSKISGRKIFYHCGGIYFLFGCSYVIYITFFVTSLIEERGLSELAAGSLWSWIGLLSLVSGPLFGDLSDRYGRKLILAVVFVLQTCAYLLATPSLPMFSVYLSLSCYGLVAWSIPTIIAALVGDYAGPEQTAKFFGLVTFAFGIGQIVGPGCAGFLAEQSGSFSLSFQLAAVLTAVAVGLSLLLPGKSRWEKTVKNVVPKAEIH